MYVHMYVFLISIKFGIDPIMFICPSVRLYNVCDKHKPGTCSLIEVKIDFCALRPYKKMLMIVIAFGLR